MNLRGSRVLVRVDERGTPVPGSDGRVEVRYRAGESRAYRAAPRNLEPFAADSELLPDAACSDVLGGSGATAEPSSGSSGSSSRSKAAAKSSKKSAAASRAAQRVHAEGTIIVYADGACSGNPGPAGIGVVVQDGAVRKELSQFLGQGTNNIAELTALLEAANLIDTPERPVRMHTDSKYAIGVLSQGWKAKANQELIARTKKALTKLQDCELIHVPGHAGVLLNERADVLAVQAVKDEASTGWVVYESKAAGQ
jgi:ribonuclease HI